MVVAIIAILASLLLPLLGKAKAAASRTQCINNVRQLQLAWQMYPGDNDGWLAPNYPGLGGKFPHLPSWVGGWIAYGDPDGTNTFWLTGDFPGSLGRYTSNTGVYKCPADRSLTTLGGRQHPRVRSYQMNEYLGFVTAQSTDTSTIYHRESQLGQPGPAGHFVFIDAHEDRIDDGMFDIFPDARLSTPPGVRHGRGTTLSFADGHVEVHKWKDPRTIYPVTGVMWEDPNFPPNNRDIHWLARRATWSKTYGATLLPDP